jgi:alpha-mannosidase
MLFPRSRATLLILSLMAVPPLVSGAPLEQRRIYIAPDDHTDYVWSADEETYRQAFLETLDYYLDQADKTASNAPEHQSRWNCDGSLWMWIYERNKTPAQFERFLQRVRDGHISVPLNPLVSCYGGTPLEAILRGMYYAGRVERRHGIRFPLAVAMENQTLPYGLGALFAGSGARYSWRGICGCASRLAPIRHTLRPHEIYWWRGPDDSRILMKWNSLFREGETANKCIGGYAEAFDPAASLRFVETDSRFQSAWPYRVVGIFGKGWDRLKTLDQEVVATARERTTPARKVIVSNEEDFFRDFEAAYGKQLPAFSAAFGNEWDLYTASVAEVSARVRRSVEKLRTAEALATLVSLKRPTFLNGRESARDLAFLNLGLFWEHNWTSDGPVTRSARAEWGRKLAGEIEDYAGRLESDAAYALGALIRRKGSNPRFYVFNPLSWTRTDVVDLPYDGPPEVRVIDLESNAELPSQVVTAGWRIYVKGRQQLRVLAAEVPPAGYRVLEIRTGAPRTLSGAPTVRNGVLENSFYRLAVAPNGAITSLIDKTRGNREFARTIAGRSINDLGPAEGELAIENAGPVSVTLKAQVRAPLARTTRITLYRDVNRIDIANEITQKFSDVRSWAFGFNLDSPDMWHEEVGAVIRARLANDGGHYSPVHARLDWLTLNHFAAMSGADGAGVTLSNADLAFMKLGASSVNDGISRLDTTTPQISVLAGGQVDGPSLGIPEQGGDSYFLQRFALTAHTKFNAVEAMRFALEHQNPLVAAAVAGGDAYPEKSYSLLTLPQREVLLWVLKPAEEGISKGIIARLWHLSTAPRDFALSLNGGIASATRVTHIETDIAKMPLERGRLSGSIAPWQILTLRLKGGSAGRAPASPASRPRGKIRK